MFTGIITDIGTVKSVAKAGDTRFDIATHYAASGIALGASIACSGICLTVVDKGRDGDGDWFGVEVSQATLRATNAGDWKKGHRLNLERALRAGDELGGHIVSGHVDGLAKIISITLEGASQLFVFSVAREVSQFIASKGSVTLNGTSLTVNEIYDNAQDTHFGVNIIPHTQSATNWRAAKAGDKVNLEIDVLARYVARMNEKWQMINENGKDKE